MPATRTPTPSPARRHAPITPRAAERLKALTAAIKAGRTAQEARARQMIALRTQGHSLEAIGEAAGINKEQVRKSIMRRQGGYPADEAGR